jgi:hypothetical protein
MIAGLTGINAYESAESDSAISDGRVSTGEFR